jgi:hypothetical protein
MSLPSQYEIDQERYDRWREYEHEVNQERELMRHPDCRDPEHPGCEDCTKTWSSIERKD